MRPIELLGRADTSEAFVDDSVMPVDGSETVDDNWRLHRDKLFIDLVECYHAVDAFQRLLRRIDVLNVGEVFLYASTISISNDFQWQDNIDPTAKDSLYDYSIFFAPYGANDLCDILSQRSTRLFGDTLLTYEFPDPESFGVGINIGARNPWLGRWTLRTSTPTPVSC